MRAFIALAWLAACGGNTGSLLSASRVSVNERLSTRIYVDAPLSAVALPASDGLVFVPQEESGTTTSVDIFASCNAAHGRDATLSVQIGDTRDPHRVETLVVTVVDDSSDACLAELQMWDEPCSGAACDDPCGPPPPGLLEPHDLQIEVGESHRICMHSTAVDVTRPLDGVELQLDPDDAAFTHQDSGDDKALVVHGKPWLVGNFHLALVAHVGDTEIRHPVTLAIGHAPATGIEVLAAGPATEFQRSAIGLRVHHFPGACMLDAPLAHPYRSRLTNDVTGDSVAGGNALPCDDEHGRYTLGIVPGIAAPLGLDIALTATNATANVPLKVMSLADDLPACTSFFQPTEVACADVDQDGTLDVVRMGSGSSCATGVTDWRAEAATTTITAPAGSVRHIFAVPTPGAPQIWGIDPTNTLVRLTGSHGAWSWQAQGLAPVGQTAVPFRRGMTLGPPDTIASLIGTKARFVALDGTPIAGDATLTESNPIAIGAVRLTAGPGLAVVNDLGTGYSVAVYRVAVSTLLPPQLTLVASGVVNSMPTGASVEIAGRGIGSQDLVMVFYAGLYASAVTELAMSGSALQLITQYGGVGSISATPESTVLLGAELGSVVSGGNGLSATFTPIDPDPPTHPVQGYGRAIAPCFDAMSKMVGFVERTGIGARVARRDIVPEEP